MIHQFKTYKKCLTIAGSDTSGGAGIQADLRIFQMLRVYGLSVITSLTAQNSRGVQYSHPLDPQWVEEQVLTILTDKNLSLDGIKIGMLGHHQIVRKLSEIFLQLKTKQKLPPIVLDPVCLSSSGMPLLDEQGIEMMKEFLFPQTFLLTPNLLEAAKFLQDNQLLMHHSHQQIEQATARLCELGPRYVLLKGGHRSGTVCEDCLGFRNLQGGMTYHWFRHEKIESENTRGTGCSLSSAISAVYAHSNNDETVETERVIKSIEKAKKLISWLIDQGQHYSLSHDSTGVKGPLYLFDDHFFSSLGL